MKKRTIIGLLLGNGFFLITLYENIGLIKHGDEIWWFGLMMQFVWALCSYGLYIVCNKKTFQEEYEERFPKTNTQESQS